MDLSFLAQNNMGNMSLLDLLRGRISRVPGTPGINPNAPDPRILMAQNGIAQGEPMQGSLPQQSQPMKPSFVDRLDNPLSQIGLRILAGGGSNLGKSVGGAVLGYQDQKRQSVEDELKRKYLEAQIRKMGMPDPTQPSAPVIVVGPDGKPRYVSREEALGQQPYMEPKGNAQGPSELDIARALNDPDMPESVKKDLRDLLNKKYRDPSAEPLVAIQTPDGRSILVPRSQAVGASPAAPRENFVPQEGERTSANYYGRMQAAEKLLGDYTPSMTDYVAAKQMMSGGAVTGSLSNMMLSAKGQNYYQAAADWVRAKLRKESGAVISPAEMEQEIKTYFPIPGDGPMVVDQKRRAREQAMQGMREMGGRAVNDNKPVTTDDPLGIRK